MKILNENSSTTALSPSPYILVVEPDEGLAAQLRQDLQDAQYPCIVMPDVITALAQVEARSPSMVVVDRALSGDSGLSFCARLRRNELRMPILLLVMKDGVDDRVMCLEAGADDYYLKPYQTDSFIRLVQHYLRIEVLPQKVLRYGNLKLDLGTRQASRNGRIIDLTTKEFDLLKYLMENAREVLKREQILENVWGYDFGGESNVIEVYIRYLRLKIEVEGEKRLIQTVRGVGYVLREQ